VTGAERSWPFMLKRLVAAVLTFAVLVLGGRAFLRHQAERAALSAFDQWMDRTGLDTLLHIEGQGTGVSVLTATNLRTEQTVSLYQTKHILAFTADDRTGKCAIHVWHEGEPRPQVVLFDLRTKRAVRTITAPDRASVQSGPVWSQDGRQVAFTYEIGETAEAMWHGTGRSILLVIDVPTGKVAHRVALPYPAKSLDDAALLPGASRDEWLLSRVSGHEGETLGVLASGASGRAYPFPIDAVLPGGKLLVTRGGRQFMTDVSGHPLAEVPSVEDREPAVTPDGQFKIYYQVQWTLIVMDDAQVELRVLQASTRDSGRLLPTVSYGDADLGGLALVRGSWLTNPVQSGPPVRGRQGAER
jgi:hypothetical protein